MAQSWPQFGKGFKIAISSKMPSLFNNALASPSKYRPCLPFWIDKIWFTKLRPLNPLRRGTMSFNYDEKPATKQADVRDNGRSNRPISTGDLLSSERIFLSGMQHLGFGRVEGVRILGGELVLDPWPTVIQHVKFGGVSGTEGGRSDTEFQLKKQLADFFVHIRSIDKGMIRSLAIHRGLPISMELMLPPTPDDRTRAGIEIEWGTSRLAPGNNPQE